MFAPHLPSVAPYKYDYTQDDPQLKPVKMDSSHPYYHEETAYSFTDETHYPTKTQFIHAKVRREFSYFLPRILNLHRNTS